MINKIQKKKNSNRNSFICMWIYARNCHIQCAVRTYHWRDNTEHTFMCEEIHNFFVKYNFFSYTIWFLWQKTDELIQTFSYCYKIWNTFVDIMGFWGLKKKEEEEKEIIFFIASKILIWMIQLYRIQWKCFI